MSDERKLSAQVTGSPDPNYSPFGGYEAQRREYEREYPNGGPLPMSAWLANKAAQVEFGTPAERREGSADQRPQKAFAVQAAREKEKDDEPLPAQRPSK